MSILPISLVLALTFWVLPAFPDSAQDSVFAQGLESFKRSELAQSREEFLNLLANSPQDPVLLYNLGLLEWTDNHPGRAFGYWRKALYLSPGFRPALAGMSQLDKARFPGVENASLITLFSWYVPFWSVIALGFAFFTLSGWLCLRWRVRKKTEAEGAAELPWAFLGTTLGFLIIAVWGLQYYFAVFQTDGATIMEADVPAFSSPSDGAPSLFSYREGDAVIIHRESNDWVQVQRSATSVGWVRKKQILRHSGS